LYYCNIAALINQSVVNIVITGASTGIGYALAKRCAAVQGNRVVVVSRNRENLLKLAGSAAEGTIIPVVTDIALFDFDLLHQALRSGGIETVDVLINNAGMLINKPFEDIEMSEWQSVYNVNVFGAAAVIRTLLPLMGKGERPSHVVNISSIGGVNGTSKYPGLTAYSSSKGALCTLTECLAAEFTNRGVLFNCLALGAVQTEMLSKAFPGYQASMTPEVISDLIYDFAATGWRYYNGKILQISTTNP
jgi:3-oxoacyl-[acyl-carrier protein] reductase